MYSSIFFQIYFLGGPTHNNYLLTPLRKKLSGLVPRHSETVTQTVAAEGIRTEHGLPQHRHCGGRAQLCWSGGRILQVTTYFGIKCQ